MTDIVIIASGACAECGHGQEAHDQNTGCTAPSDDDDTQPCLCENIGNY